MNRYYPSPELEFLGVPRPRRRLFMRLSQVLIGCEQVTIVERRVRRLRPARRLSQGEEREWATTTRISAGSASSNTSSISRLPLVLILAVWRALCRFYDDSNTDLPRRNTNSVRGLEMFLTLTSADAVFA